MALLETLFGAAGIKDLVLGVLDRIKMNPEQRAQVELALAQNQIELVKLEAELELKAQEASSENIKTEIASGTWLGKNVRPLFLLCGTIAIWLNVFLPLIVQFTSKQVTPINIPDSVYWLFGMGFLGYTGARSFEKIMSKKLEGG